MKIDIGCGLNSDLNASLPLPDNTVEFVMASRSLPYVHHFESVMGELYRLCIHKAAVCILAPYAHSFALVSNPLLKHKFDEYTPRYLAASFFQPSQGAICPELYAYWPETPPPYDFRLLRMELFYQAPFVPPLYELEELEVLKTLQANVVHEIMYHFVVIKEPVSDDELEQMSRGVLPEPNHATDLRREYNHF
ncbi:hypothetical protein [Paenibacillus tyrfis]|uniref:hypothetical protein n=1 Tax=Paenibacillus tyrfis TaxID=1501230 RepID=UPI00209CC996|nr:hypothetical protein [Paenibacillus tyrfis]MCP1308770.1 hypothetical protein [Paenibacillus tyrfis]